MEEFGLLVIIFITTIFSLAFMILLFELDGYFIIRKYPKIRLLLQVIGAINFLFMLVLFTIPALV